MGFMSIDNLYKKQDILLFKEVWAMEKIHGSSASVIWDGNNIRFFSGGERHERFVSIFNQEFLVSKFKELCNGPVTIFGEVYGGKCQGMSKTYGKDLKFIAFDVQAGYYWWDVPKAEAFVLALGLEFVHYKRVTTDLAVLDAERDADSVQAIRNGMGPGKLREGVILRPLIELRKNNGERIIAKHKRDEFRETKSPRPVDAEKLKMLENANLIADEWVTPARLKNILSHLPEEKKQIENMTGIIALMQNDIVKEGTGEVVLNQDTNRAIARKTALLFKEILKSNLYQ